MTKYIESQKFYAWIGLLCLALSVFMIYLLVKTYNTPTFIVLLLVGLLPSLLLTLLFLTARLNTEIDQDGIRIKFIPFHLKQVRFNWTDIESCEVRKYNPLLEFGGWGIRYGFRGKVYNTKGNIGIHLVLKSGRKVVIGTQNADMAGKFIEKYFNKKK